MSKKENLNLKNNNINTKYKLKELKVFGTPEWLAESKKKYRCVFDQSETSYIYAEFSFYNKLFDEEDWEADISLIAYNVTDPENGVRVCELKYHRKISKDENIYYFREGWGTDEPGSFWKKGIYLWEAWIADKLVVSKYFYIENFGTVTTENNPYFKVISLKLFEGPDFLLPKNERVYYKRFKDSETRYIWLEMEVENLHPDTTWQGEFFISFYNDTRQLKAQLCELRSLFPSESNKIYFLEVGWGSNEKGTWFKDKYTVEVAFMDQLVAVLPFEVSAEFEEGVVNYSLPGSDKYYQPSSPSVEISKEEIFDNINALIGLEGIKQRLKEYVSYINFINLRKEKGFEDTKKINLHAVFTGNPGTGKTTVAKLLGRIYNSLGLLSKGTVHQVDRSDLIGKFIGQTAPKVKEEIEKARGGILFIDEAYSLARSEDDTTDFGREAIEILVKELSEGPGDIAVIVAGYPKEMKTFINSNPGLKSRFNYWYDFPDYLPQELILIAGHACKKRSVDLSSEAKSILFTKIVEAYRTRDNTFGNARYINSIIDEAKLFLGLRVMSHPDPACLSQDDLSTILPEDIQKIFDGNGERIPEIPVDEDLLKEAMNELNGMIGISTVKNEINELVKLVRFYREIKKDVLNAYSLHAVFTGNPGTGKTTVARIISKIYKALGLLERGHLVECDRASLVAGFIGQTAIKTAEKIDLAIGGVLFIDEAYSLTMYSGSASDFGGEAIQVLLKRMEDRKNRFAVIAAGYIKEMQEFLEYNPGLKSRFDKVLHFDDYSADDLMKIAMKMLSDENIKADSAAIDHLNFYFELLYKNRDKFFGNARTIKKIVIECIKNQNLRLASIPANQRTEDMIHTLVYEDVKEFQSSKEHLVSSSQKKIGFSLE